MLSISTLNKTVRGECDELIREQVSTLLSYPRTLCQWIGGVGHCTLKSCQYTWLPPPHHHHLSAVQCRAFVSIFCKLFQVAVYSDMKRALKSTEQCLGVKFFFHGQPLCKKYQPSEPGLKRGTRGLWNEAKLALGWAWAVCAVNTLRGKKWTHLAARPVGAVSRAEKESLFYIFYPKKIWCIAFKTDSSGGPKSVCIWGLRKRL